MGQTALNDQGYMIEVRGITKRFSALEVQRQVSLGVRPSGALVVLLADGQVVEEAPPADFFGAPKAERTKRFLRELLPESGEAPAAVAGA